MQQTSALPVSTGAFCLLTYTGLLQSEQKRISDGTTAGPELTSEQMQNMFSSGIVALLTLAV
jgi:hypothetical protein